jgi:general secretion pathway protein I
MKKKVSRGRGFEDPRGKKYSFTRILESLNPRILFCGKGFTLLEILIALAIVGGLLVTVISTLNYHLGIVERHETITVATLLAKEKMVDLEKNPIQTKGNFEDPYQNYTYETSVKDSPYAGISEIIVVVKAGDEEVKLNEFIFE